jgi:hypothetical protein
VLVVGGAAAVLATGCGGQDKQDADEPEGNFTVAVTRAEFPEQQRIARQARMTIVVRNTGAKRIPNVSITLYPGGQPTTGGSSSGSGAQGQGVDAFGFRTTQPGVSDPARPVWIVDRGPKQRLREGPGGAVTAYVNTWALGPLAPGKTRTFTWDVTPVKPGVRKIGWRVNAGLDGKAKAKLSDGSIPRGTFETVIRGDPAEAVVGDDDQVVRTDE